MCPPFSQLLQLRCGHFDSRLVVDHIVRGYTLVLPLNRLLILCLVVDRLLSLKRTLYLWVLELAEDRMVHAGGQNGRAAARRREEGCEEGAATSSGESAHLSFLDM